MKESFRQSMAWLHTWVGLVAAWILFFIFVTGTAGYFQYEITRWMQPERPLQQAAAVADKTQMINLAMNRLEAVAQNAEHWSITFPHRPQPYRGEFRDFSISWSDLPEEGHERGLRGAETLDPQTGAVVQPVEVRETGGGALLYRMHYALHYMDRLLAYRLVGICTMLMLVAIISGVIVHKKIFKDFFTFRPNKTQRSWLDAHNVISVMALPFFLMITYSGFLFFTTSYMPAVRDVIYGTDQMATTRYFDELFEREEHEHLPVVRPRASVSSMLAEAETRWGSENIASILIQHDAGEEPRVEIQHLRPSSLGTVAAEKLTFHAHTGALLANEPDTERSAALKTQGIFFDLHEGVFAGIGLRWLYFVSGLLGCAMIGTGLVLWASKRRKKAANPGFGLRLVDALNVSTLVGMCAGVAFYFWANRLLPVDIAGRAGWEANALFFIWGQALLYAWLRNDTRRTWIELSCFAALAYVLVPLINWLTTDKHLGVTLPAGDWVLAGFDLVMFGLAAAFVVIALKVSKHWPVAAVNDKRTRQAALSAQEVV
ncbi:PepSY-associated TM helix domain-containing protein [Pseudomonas sp. FME51]|uniref:PepSY-associated TM helix domain-containing protein n=1 Tax=Pseudomonas sp. FME51 TaxID=2742609 RepID=UPI001867FE6E|nr:PepSY-associated TM helix domain-containing protein [Pseudomonas sp. FME51]